MKKYLSIIFSVVLFPLFANPYLLGNRNNPASVKVVPDGENLQVSCTFKAQTRFSPERNAQFNFRKAEGLCRKGLLLYMNAKPGQSIDLSGITTAKQPERSGKMITYYFTKIGKSKVNTVVQQIAKPASTFAKNNSAAYREKTTLAVVRYQATNNKVDVVDTKVYHANSFKNRAEFEDFCEKQFDSIDRKFSEEMNKILNHFEEAKRNIKNK